MTILVVTVFKKIVTKVESLRKIVFVLENVKVSGESCWDDEEADGVAKLSVNEKVTLGVVVPDNSSETVGDEGLPWLFWV